ncbi:MAG: PHP domain-containing protein [Thermovirgaceae bacterium]|nr:PHP domain-containing protein [Thermovirgaceae bacterium]
MISVDLHTHSTFSDGTFTPEALVRRAAKRHVAIISLTDHDTTSGLEKFMNACKKEGVQGVPGVELSAEAPFTLHIMGYRIDSLNKPFQKKLENLRTNRRKRNEEMIGKLVSLGASISMEEVAAESGGEVVARPHIARVMVSKGFVPDMASAFKRYIGRGCPAYVPSLRLAPEECLSAVREAGGLPVLGHPGLMGLDEDELFKLLGSLVDHGLWGLECISGHHGAGEIYYWLKVAAKFGLFPTAGSDFHGVDRPGTELGVSVTEGLLPWPRLGVRI